jgi:AraC-like DNA-binding protein
LDGRIDPCSVFDEFFGGDVEFDASVDEVAFATTVKQVPVVSADPYLNKFMITHCEEALSHRPKNSGSFRSSVENAIVPLLPHGKARVGEIAHRLGVSQRTFARRLSLERLTFSAVLEGLRSDLAKRYLADGDLSISQISWLLGYQEVSALTHAFKRCVRRNESSEVVQSSPKLLLSAGDRNWCRFCHVAEFAA